MIAGDAGGVIGVGLVDVVDRVVVTGTMFTGASIGLEGGVIGTGCVGRVVSIVVVGVLERLEVATLVAVSIVAPRIPITGFSSVGAGSLSLEGTVGDPGSFRTSRSTTGAPTIRLAVMSGEIAGRLSATQVPHVIAGPRPRECREIRDRIAPHVARHRLHPAALASVSIDVAKLSSLGLKPWVLETVLLELLASAPNSCTDPCLHPVNMADALIDCRQDIALPRLELLVLSV